MRIYLILIAFLSLSQAHAGRTCYWGGYTFKGHFYSDTFLPKNRAFDLSVCRTPELNEGTEWMGNDFKTNREKIDKLAAEILKDGKCKEGIQLVQNYLNQRDKNEKRINESKNSRIEALEEGVKSEDVQIQSDFTMAGHYNAACSNEDHRSMSMLNLHHIDQLLASKVEPPVEKVTKDKPAVEDCRNVVALGSDNLDGFTVSMKKGTNKNFLFMWDPFSIPDRVIVTNTNSKVLYDSGCKGVTERQEMSSYNLEASQDSNLTIKVINNCDEKYKDGHSAWMLRLKCESTTNECKERLNVLAELIKEETEILKKVLMHYEHERQCFLTYGAGIFKDLMNRGLVMEDVSAVSLGICPPDDIVCESMFQNEVQLDSRAPASTTTPEPEADCGPAPGTNHSLFERISYAYCKVGRKRLGL